jgi:hypothetical protein
MGARNRVGIGLPYRPDRLHSLAELVPRNRYLESLKVYKFGLCTKLGWKVAIIMGGGGGVGCPNTVCLSLWILPSFSKDSHSTITISVFSLKMCVKKMSRKKIFFGQNDGVYTKRHKDAQKNK